MEFDFEAEGARRSNGIPERLKMTFGRMPRPFSTFNLASGELVTAERIDVGKPAPGKFIAPVNIWVRPKN
jgi:hypothetical protein